MSDLNILYPRPHLAEVRGISAKLHPIKLRNAQLFIGLAAEFTALMAAEPEEVSALGAGVFCAKNESRIVDLLLAQTSLTKKQVRNLSASEAAAWLAFLVEYFAADFNQALLEVTESLSSGAKSTSA